MKMKQLKILSLIAVLTLCFTSCSDDDDTTTGGEALREDLITGTVENLYATLTSQRGEDDTGEFIKFNFKTESIVTGDDWDIAFRTTVILVNGGTKIGDLNDEPERTGNASLALVLNSFEDVTEAPDDTEFKQDGTGSYALAAESDLGWYNYAGHPTHLITPVGGRVIVVKTIDGNYAKLTIKSYYKDEDSASESRYYTFDYVYNPNVGDKTLQ